MHTALPSEISAAQTGLFPGRAARSVYLDAALTRIPQVLSQIDREAFSLTYGCGDRVYWCWKFTDFAGARFQEYLYTLAWLVGTKSDTNPWYNNENLIQQIEAGFSFWSSLQHKNGSFDEAYPLEHSLAATAFTLYYLTDGFELCKHLLSKSIKQQFLETVERGAHWLTKNDETHGFLSNHLAAASAACWNAFQLLNNSKFADRCQYFQGRILSAQSPEGWYQEYGGADIGYQTHGSFYLARLWEKTGSQSLLNSLKRANHFLSHFVHPDGSVGGEYASRNTMFYFPAAYEILYNHCGYAKAISDYQRNMIFERKTVGLEQMDAYNLFPMLNNYLHAHDALLNKSQQQPNLHKEETLAFQTIGTWIFADAGMHVKSTQSYFSIVGAKKGGVVRVWDKASGAIAFQSSGYVLKEKSKLFSNQAQGTSTYTLSENGNITIDAPFIEINQKIFHTPLFLCFRLFSITFGRLRFLSYWLKKQLVRTLVSQKRVGSTRLIRRIQFEEHQIALQDELSNPATSVQFIDKFTTFHMGSSRYVHLEEEKQRRCHRPQSQSIQFAKNGTISSAVLKLG